jgi:hypothetical protein
MNNKRSLTTLAAAALTCLLAPAWAVTPEEAAQLKNTLTPMGAEKAANKDGSIPAWTGGNTTATPGFKNGGKRPDPFAAEKPLYSVTSKNLDQYADKLSDGVKAMFKKYPASYRIDVYPTHRTAAAPQWVYANTLANATRAKIDNLVPTGVYGGEPFPIPKSGAEAMWNHVLRWRGEGWHWSTTGWLVTADGKKVQSVDGGADQQMPYYFKDGTLEAYTGDYWQIRMVNAGPPIRAGEAITGRLTLDPAKSQTWVYLTGQRRVRKLPNACCDTPSPATAGVMSFDEMSVFNGELTRFDWKLVGKKEMLIPYNTNRSMQVKVDDLLGEHHLNPEHVRWELHRVWVVEATLAAGKRHQTPKSRYYLDEDSWIAVLGDRWDANGQLWRTLWNLPMSMPDLPGVVATSFGMYDLNAGSWFANDLYNEKAEQYKITARYPDKVFTPEAMAGEGVR